MKPEQVGNCVKFGNRIIPAQEIYVTNVPGFVLTEAGPSWRGLRFKIIFPDATVWVVEQGTEYMDKHEWDETITLIESKTKAFTTRTATIKLANWVDFLDLYNEKLEAKEKYGR